MKNITIGKEIPWEFAFRYNLPIMEADELKVIMIKYEVELKRCIPGGELHNSIVEILGKIYSEIMRRNLKTGIEKVEARIYNRKCFSNK